MRIAVIALLLVWPGLAPAKVVNVEFKFTPYTGDPAKEDHVQSVRGTARVFVNNVPLAEQNVEARELPVLFDERELAPSVWMPAASLGPVVRKGKNTLRIEFEPADGKAAYHAQLRWASVLDEAKAEGEPGRYRGTNQSGEGVEDKPATGTIVMEREFAADFAKDEPWHHLPAVTALTDEDKQRIAAVARERADWFKPDFATLYKALERKEQVDIAEVRKAKCIDAAYKAGVRITALPAEKLEFVTTGGPEVVVRGKDGGVFPPDVNAFERIKGDAAQMCAGMVLALMYPARLVAVHTPNGGWEIVY